MSILSEYNYTSYRQHKNTNIIDDLTVRINYLFNLIILIKTKFFTNLIKLKYRTFKYHLKSSPSGLNSVTFSKFAFNCNAIFYKLKNKTIINLKSTRLFNNLQPYYYR